MRPSIFGSMVLVSLCVASSAAEATQCPVVTVLPHPQGEAIPTNGLFFIQENFSNTRIRSVKEADVWLEGGGERIPLQIWTTSTAFDGQITLKPKRKLKPSTTYVIDSEHPLLASRLGPQVGRWTTASGRDDAPPRWVGSPKIVGCNTEDAICPVSEQTMISIPAEDDSGVFLVVIEMWRPDEPYAWFHVPVVNGQIAIGWGECFTHWIDEGKNYRLTFSALDRAGNMTKAPESLTFNRTIVFNVPEGRRLTIAGKLAVFVAAPFALGFTIVFVWMNLRRRRR
jgi:hypothetical protein